MSVLRFPLSVRLAVAFGIVWVVLVVHAFLAEDLNEPKAGMNIGMALFFGWFVTGFPALVCGVVGLTDIDWSQSGCRVAARLAGVSILIGAGGPVLLILFPLL